MAVTTTQTNKPINPRGNDQSPKGYNRAALYSGKALDFDGVNDILTMPTALTSSLSTTSVTFVTNVKTDFATWSGTRDDAFSFAERGMILTFLNGAIYYFYRHSSGWQTLQVPTANFKPQEWNQMVTTIDLNADTWKAYINGIEVATSGTYSDTAIAYDSKALTIGAQAGERFFDGQIAGFKIFNTALTAAQVADLYNNPEKVVPTGVDNTALKLWLPMQEGAGTTAYDGSGNGNHGTISGATYVNGVGAPVAQTAVIDWNKGANLLKYSEQIDNAVYTTGGGSGHSVVVTANHGTAPDGTQTADRVQITRGSVYAELFQRTTTSMVVGEDYVLSFYAKSLSGTPTLYTAWNNAYVNEVTFTSEWVRYDYVFQYVSSGTGSGLNLVTWVDLPTTSTTADLLVWGAQVEQASSVGPYIPTLATAQTSPVLLPQGLTSGRDITGVNLFENVRKQGALNLDGKSWAEVHDNASLDFGTGSFTLEAWVKAKYINQGSVFNMIISLGDNITSSNNAGLMLLNNNVPYFIYSNPGASSGSAQTEGDWIHLVGTYDETNTTLYVNGVQVDQDARTASDITNGFAKLIGRDGTDPNRYYNDQIAQPRIYNRALTAEEVQRSYDSGKNIFTNS